ncbi:MAG: TM2 domain-containing protein [Eubacterium sp.]|nr:TM2 domain-containing protein [Eubacterium sp.]
MSKLEKTTYVEKVNADGKVYEIRKFKCPKCGNKDLNYQVVGEGAYTSSKTFFNLYMTGIINATHAICPKCGTSFKTREYHRVNKGTYCVLAAFLGSLGIHKFYAKHTMDGLKYLVFCWTFIPGLIAFFYDFFCGFISKSR